MVPPFLGSHWEANANPTWALCRTFKNCYYSICPFREGNFSNVATSIIWFKISSQVCCLNKHSSSLINQVTSSTSIQLKVECLKKTLDTQEGHKVEKQGAPFWGREGPNPRKDKISPGPWLMETQSWELTNGRKAGHQWLIPVILATQDAEIRSNMVQNQPRQIILKSLSQKYPTWNRAGVVAWMVEYPPSKHEALCSNPIPTKK
jgi:hypothetical protein